jgi:Iron-containing redox enzyme
MNLRKKFEEVVSKTADDIRSYPWEDPAFYKSWLAQQYFLVRHTPRLLCALALRVQLEDQKGFAEALHHLREETGHDQWLLADMKKMGTDPSHHEAIPAASAMIKAQYYQIQHDDPLSLCGYSQYLEYLSVLVAGEIADRVKAAHGKNAAVFLSGHANVDVEHAEDGWKIIERANKVQAQKIVENLEMTEVLYKQMYNEIIKRLDNKISSNKAAA